MTQDEAKAIIEREPVGGAQFYSYYTDRFFSKIVNVWYYFDGQWNPCQPHIRTENNLKPMHEILAIALGGEK